MSPCGWPTSRLASEPLFNTEHKAFPNTVLNGIRKKLSTFYSRYPHPFGVKELPGVAFPVALLWPGLQLHFAANAGTAGCTSPCRTL